MNKINLLEVYKDIENLCIKLNRRVNKKDITFENGFKFHYNTYMNAGLRLNDFNFYEILYNQDPKLCKYCNIKISYSKRENLYCSSSCSASFNNKFRKQPLDQCLVCNNFTKRKKSLFCSPKCKKNHDFLRKIRNWCLGNDIYDGKKIKKPTVIKRLVITMNGYVCDPCGLSSLYNGKRLTLELDHINGDATNNNKDNVRLLCPNCHSLTPTFKGKNKGNGTREWRKKRYHEGKSY